MKLRKLLNIFSSKLIRVLGLSLFFSLISITTESVTAITKSGSISSSENISLKVKSGTFLIAASPELTTILQQSIPGNSSRVRVINGGLRNYDQAYTRAWLDFSRIIDQSTLRFAGTTPSAGRIYTANLKGGGTGNIREGGSSGPIPTIDIRNHNTPGIASNGVPLSRIIEIKYIYSRPFCPVATSNGC